METAIRFLQENASAVIAYRTKVELLGQDEQTVFYNEQAALLEAPLLKQWLSRLRPFTDFNSLHGSDPCAFENVAGKLHELGFRPWMLPDWDQRLKSHLNALKTPAGTHGLSEFSRQYIFQSLLAFGCENSIVRDRVLQRIEELAGFTALETYDLYVDQNTFGAFPKAFCEKPLINPVFNNQLPLIWDIYTLAYLPSGWRTPAIDEKIDQIIRYILDVRYQRLPIGYGMIYHPPTRRYYAMGWSIHLPDFENFDCRPAYWKSMFLQRLELMSHFTAAHTSPWFQKNMNHLKQFQIDAGNYRFPGDYLHEQTAGYWVTGAYMRMEENRRRKISLELDSTFRMLHICHNIKNGNSISETVK